MSATMYDRPRFISASGRTVGFLDQVGMERLAEEYEHMRDRIARLELEAALLRSVLDVSGIAIPCRNAARR